MIGFPIGVVRFYIVDAVGKKNTDPPGPVKDLNERYSLCMFHHYYGSAFRGAVQGNIKYKCLIIPRQF